MKKISIDLNDVVSRAIKQGKKSALTLDLSSMQEILFPNIKMSEFMAQVDRLENVKSVYVEQWENYTFWIQSHEAKAENDRRLASEPDVEVEQEPEEEPKPEPKKKAKVTFPVNLSHKLGNIL